MDITFNKTIPGASFLCQFSSTNFMNTFVIFFCPAYEEKQHSKRKEIASRSWFKSPSAPAGGAAGSLLQKLGHQGKEAAVAKALGSSHNPVLCRRAAGSGFATVAHKKTKLEAGPSSETKETTCTVQGAANGRAAREVQECVTDDADKKLNSTEECATKEQQSQRSAATTSLVADYSDSDSDGGEWAAGDGKQTEHKKKSSCCKSWLPISTSLGGFKWDHLKQFCSAHVIWKGML